MSDKRYTILNHKDGSVAVVDPKGVQFVGISSTLASDDKRNIAELSAAILNRTIRQVPAYPTRLELARGFMEAIITGGRQGPSPLDTLDEALALADVLLAEAGKEVE